MGNYAASVTETTESDPLAGFAAMMAGAESEARPAGRDEAPYGWTRDESTGEMRPKKSPGRPRKSPSLDDLKAQAGRAEPEGPAVSGDRPPVAPKGRDRRRGREKTDAPPVPQKYRAEGTIAKGINQLYRRAGRIVRVADADVGQALIDITRAESPEDMTVGDAWEALARSNPRVRGVLLRLLAGGAWSAVFMAHAPVAMAVLMKESVRSRVPFGRLAAVLADDDGEGPGEAPAAGTPFENLRPEDVAQMQAMAQAMAEQVMSRGPGVPERGE